MTSLDDIAIQFEPVTVEVQDIDVPFGGVQVFGISDEPIQIVLREGSPGPQGIPGIPGPAGENASTTLVSGTTLLINGQNYIDVTFPGAQPEWTALTLHVVNVGDPDPLVLIPGTITQKTDTGFRVYFNGAPDSNNYYLMWGVFGGAPVPPIVATTYTLVGPASGNVGLPSTNFTVALPSGQSVPSPVTITPGDGGDGGTFIPASVQLSTGSPVATFTYTAASTGNKTISTTNDGGLTDPAPLTYNVVDVPHLLTDLISYWKFDDASLANPAVDSHGANDLATGGSGFNGGFAGVINTCGYYDGSTTYAPNIASNASLKPTGDFAFSVWLRKDANVAVINALSKGDFAVALDWSLGHSPANGFYFSGGTGTAQVGSPAADFSMNHVVFWFDSNAGTLNIRVNDTVTHTTPGTITFGNDPFCVGSFFNAGVPFNGVGQWNGLIDELAFWHRIPTAAEITQLYNGGAGWPLSSFT